MPPVHRDRPAISSMTEMENAVMQWTRCNRAIARVVVAIILKIDKRTKEVQLCPPSPPPLS